MNPKLLQSLSLIFLVLLLNLSLLGCAEKIDESNSFVTSTVPIALSYAKQADIDNIANDLDVKYRMISNTRTEYCDAKVGNGACFEVELSFTATEAIYVKGWSIYFSQISPVQSSISDEFKVTHLNGDIHEISLLETFSGFKANETKKIIFRAGFWMLSETDALPNYIVSADDLQAKTIISTQTIIDKESGIETLPFVQPFTDELKQFKRTSTDETKWLTSKSLYQRNAEGVNSDLLPLRSFEKSIIPTPKLAIFDKNNAFVDISNGLTVDFSNVKKSDVNAALARLEMLGIKQSKNGFPITLHIHPNKSKPIGSYKLLVGEKGINVIGVDGSGVFNGLQSLASLYTVGQQTLPVVNVDDEPHYSFRGMLVDVARNFHSKEFILSLLDQMAAYKLNKLHLHLGDDEGWRLEIPTLPELTDISSKRCFDKSEQHCLISQLGAGVDSRSLVNGFYSVADYQEILQSATARHIQVIPSLDMPGHSRAAIKAMTARYNKYLTLEDKEKAMQFLLEDFEDKTQYSSVQFYNDNTLNVCLESTYDFILEVMTQVKKMHSDAGQPLTRYHIGADETAGAWLESPACKKFVGKNDKGVTNTSELGAYFIERIAGILFKLNIETAGWSDGIAHTRKENMPTIVQANSWDTLSWGGHNKVHALVKRDWEVVLSSPDVLYFDFPYEADPKEHGYYWASRHTNTEKIFQFMPDNLPVHAEIWLDREDHPYTVDDTELPLAKGETVLGIQGQLWSENSRTDDVVEHKVFPRLLALAERAWHLPVWAVPYNHAGGIYSQKTQNFTKNLKKSRDNEWRFFAQSLGRKEFIKLELAGINYRLPTVGAIIEQGVLKANIAFPGLGIEYQLQNSQGKEILWEQYNRPVKVKGPVSIRSRTVNGLRSGRITKVPMD